MNLDPPRAYHLLVGRAGPSSWSPRQFTQGKAQGCELTEPLPTLRFQGLASISAQGELTLAVWVPERSLPHFSPPAVRMLICNQGCPGRRLPGSLLVTLVSYTEKGLPSQSQAWTGSSGPPVLSGRPTAVAPRTPRDARAGQARPGSLACSFHRLWPHWPQTFFFFFLTGVKLFYNVALVSAAQGSELARCIHIPAPSSSSLPFIPLI